MSSCLIPHLPVNYRPPQCLSMFRLIFKSKILFIDRMLLIKTSNTPLYEFLKKLSLIYYSKITYSYKVKANKKTLQGFYCLYLTLFI